MTWLTRLRVEEAGHDASGRAVWELIDPLWFRSSFGDVLVPAGFRTNYASVPRAPFVFWLAGDRSHKEAALHDWLYTVHTMPREDADAVFLEALLLNPLIPEGLAQSMHTAVRWFGKGSWIDTTNVLQLPEIRAQILSPAGE
jgi:hypothetical protein